MNLSKNLTLDQVTKSNTAKKQGISNIPTDEHIANLKTLAEAIFEPVYAFMEGKIYISSGYRGYALNKAVNGSKTSYHCRGMALDLVSTHPTKTNKDLFNFIKDKLQFSELIWEKGTSLNPAWVHVGYEKNKLKKEVFTTV